MKTSRVFSMLFAAMMMSNINSAPTNQIGSGLTMGGYNPMFIPRRGKFKGWMRENRRSSFNKNR